MNLAWPWMLTLLPLPLLVCKRLKPVERTPSQAVIVPFYAQLGESTRAHGTTPRRVLSVVAALAWIVLVFAAARPQSIGEPISIPDEGRDLLVAVDISGSMAREDLELDGRPADRLSVVSSVARDFLQRREGDRVGLILFGSQAYLQAPPTPDRETVAKLLGEAEIGLAGEETAIGDAIGLAVKHLRDRPADERVLVLMSDGANNAGTLDPMVAARLAAEEQVRIYAIGVGADRMVVDTPLGRRLVDPSADLDEQALANIAEVTGGAAFRARDTAGLAEIYRHIDQLEPSLGDDVVVRPTRELFPLPLLAAICLFGLVALGSTRPVASVLQSIRSFHIRPTRRAA